MIDNPDLQNILLTATDISIVCEIYDSDAVPADDGFDPGDAIDCFAAIDGITFMGATYKPLVKKFGNIKRTTNKEPNSTSVEFSNLSREISQFQFDHDFEGLIMVIRLISRSLSTTLDTSQILFAGRCDKPKSGKSDSFSVSATFILNTLDVVVPRRKFGPDDQEGRVASDPEFEGFIFVPQYGTTSYQRRIKKGGFLGWWNKKWVTFTLQWSSYSDLDANKSVPEVFGRAQLMGVLIAAADTGTNINGTWAFCEGEIDGYENIRSTINSLPVIADTELYGKVGTLNGNAPGWPGGDSYNSRTANVRAAITGSAVDVVDEAPDLVAVILGRKMPTWDGAAFSGSNWNANAAAHTRFLLTSDDYGKLDEGWIDDDYFGECYEFNDEQIFNTSVNDFLFVKEG